MKMAIISVFFLAACAPTPIYLSVKSERDPEFKFYKTQSIQVVSEINPSVSEKITREKVEDWLAFKNFKTKEEQSNFVLLVLNKEFENKHQILTLIPNMTSTEAWSGNSGSSATSIQTIAVPIEKTTVFKSLNLHLYRTKELEAYFQGKSISVSPVWEAACTTEINDMEDYERKVINTCMKSFPRSFKGRMKLQR